MWQSKCHCKVNLCYIFQCERRPPNEEELKTLKNQAKDLKDKQDKKKEDANKQKDKASQRGAQTPRTDIESQEPEPEPEPTADLM